MIIIGLPGTVAAVFFGTGAMGPIASGLLYATAIGVILVIGALRELRLPGPYLVLSRDGIGTNRTGRQRDLQFHDWTEVRVKWQELGGQRFVHEMVERKLGIVLPITVARELKTCIAGEEYRRPN